MNEKNSNLENENKNLNDNYQTLLQEQKILSDELTKLTTENQEMKQNLFNKENEILLNQNNSNKLTEINNKYDALNENKKELEKKVNALTFELINRYFLLLYFEILTEFYLLYFADK